ncbi:TBC domain-containing protein [Termitomyces sp. T112]|nr:TBC domain-containing protein [Termitomyces sp. T112]
MDDSPALVVVPLKRPTSETTIVSIYSMYGDGQPVKELADTELPYYTDFGAHSPLSPPPPSTLPTPSLSFRTSATSSRSQESTILPPTPLPLPEPQVPSDSEDVDAFHVRSTYAQLEASGVRGDGFEDGVERTRARVGPSRSSQLNAFAALDDGTEKSKSLGPKELETLASVDRYGFFAGPSHDRLVLLASSPLLKRLAPVRAPSGTAPASPPALSSLPPTRPPPKETGRIAKWMRMMVPLTRDAGANVVTWCVKQGKEAKLRRRVYKGIPDAWRGASWDYMMERYSSLGAREVDALAREYTDALDKPSTYDVQIDLDVPRTISGHIMFRTRYGAGQRSLFHVLHSFSLRCPKCGYVQGMGPIAATLLCYFDPARVYAALVRLHDAYTLHTVFSPGFPGLLEAIYVQERITQQMMPDVFDAFRRHMISTTSYATKWYITLFSNSVPFQTQLRLWDAFLLEGYDVFVAVAVAIVWVYRDQITSSTANFETVLSLLSSFFVPEDEDVLMNWIGRMLGDKKLRASMRGWKEEWRGLVAAGKEGTALL